MKLPFMVFALGICAELNAQNLPQSQVISHQPQSKPSFGMTLGYFSPTLSRMGFRDFDISDAYLYGLKSLDTNAKESRYRIPLSNELKEPVRLHGFTFGYRWNYFKDFQGGFEFNYAVREKKYSVFQMSAYLNPTLIATNKIKFQLHTATSYSYSSLVMNNLNPLPGYHPHFRESFMDLSPGGAITINNSSWIISGGVQTEYAITPALKLFANASINKTLAFGKMSIIGNGEESELEKGSRFIVQPNERTDNPEPINAKFIHTGAQFKIGLYWDFGQYDEDESRKYCECCGQIIE